MRPYWQNESIYFLTGSTFLHYPYFKEYEQKQIVLNQIKKLNEFLKIDISIYSIAINHYHLKFYLQDGLLLPKIKQIIHGGTSFEYGKKYKMNYKNMWQDSKTLMVTSEEMDWQVTGYIIGNLLKHKEVSTFEELKDTPFSSYKQIMEQYGEEVARELVYSVIDVDENKDGILDIKELNKKKIIPVANHKELLR
ncbi:MAG: hypothetical protein PHX21_05015 [bacterium]|nr:hypothetical protein [bacterium]